MAVGHHDRTNAHPAPVIESRDLSHAPAVHVSAILASEVLYRDLAAADDNARVTS